jgi:hypothetical protein
VPLETHLGEGLWLEHKNCFHHGGKFLVPKAHLEHSFSHIGVNKSQCKTQ